MIKFFTLLLKPLCDLIKSFCDGSIFTDAIREEQREYRKNHCLNKYNDNDWKDDLFW